MPLAKKHLELFSLFAHLSSYDDLEGMAIGYFCDIIPLLTRNQNGMLLFRRRKR
jgi:hypothetical protein